LFIKLFALIPFSDAKPPSVVVYHVLSNNTYRGTCAQNLNVFRRSEVNFNYAYNKKAVL